LRISSTANGIRDVVTNVRTTTSVTGRTNPSDGDHRNRDSRRLSYPHLTARTGAGSPREKGASAVGRMRQPVGVAKTDAQPGWMLDEVAHAGRENLDPDHVGRYDDKEDAGAAAEVQLLRQLGLTADSIVLDIGAGTGQLTLAVAPASRRVIALDISPVMLTRLRASVRAAGVTNIDCVHSGVLTYEHSGEPIDVAYSRYALHHLPDLWKAVALIRVHGMLRPGGIFRLSDIVYSFDAADAEHQLEAWCSTGADDAASDWTRAELEEHVRDEHSTFTWLLEPMIQRAGFVVEEASYSDDRILARYVLRKPFSAPASSR
jgi:SAM-dependent methyltransferase